MDINRSIFKGTIWGVVSNTIIIVFSFITIFLLARLLGPSEYGFLPLILSITTLLGFFAVGIGQSAARFIAEYSSKDPGYIRNILKDTMFLILIFGTLMSSILIISSKKIAFLFNEPKLETFLIIGAFFLFATYIVNYTNKIFEGFQRIDLNALRISVESISRLIFSLGLVLIGYGAVGAYMGYAVSSILAAFIGLIILYQNFFKKYPFTTKSIKKEIFNYSIPVTVINAAELIYSQIDKILIGYFLSTESVAFYSISKKIIESLNIPATSLGVAVAPAIAYGKGNNTDAINKTLFYKSIKYTVILFFPVAIGLSLFSNPIIIIFLGAEYESSIYILKLFSPLLFFFALGFILNPVMTYIGKASERIRLFGIAALLNFLLNIVFIPKFGVPGAILSTFITYIPYIYFSFKICLNEYNLTLSMFNFIFLRVAFSSFVMGYILVIYFNNINNILELVFAILIGSGTYLILIYILKLITFEEIKNIINKIK